LKAVTNALSPSKRKPRTANPIVISPSQCDCGPLGDWQRGGPMLLPPRCKPGRRRRWPARASSKPDGSDSDTLTLYCSGELWSPETTSKLADELKYTWSAAQGSFPGLRRHAHVQRPPDLCHLPGPGYREQRYRKRSSLKTAAYRPPGDVPITNTIQIKVCKVEVSNIKFNHDTGFIGQRCD